MYKRLSRLFLALVLVGLPFAHPPVYGQQTVDPSGSCSIDSNASRQIVEGQAGTYYCKPSAVGSSTGTWTLMTLGTLHITNKRINFNTAALIGTAGLTFDQNIVTVPAGAAVLFARITNNTTWAGTTTLTASVGDSTSPTKYTATIDLKVAAGTTTFVLNTAPQQSSTAATTVSVRFTSTINNLTLLTAGQLDVQVVYVLVGAGPTVIA